MLPLPRARPTRIAFSTRPSAGRRTSRFGPIAPVEFDGLERVAGRAVASRTARGPGPGRPVRSTPPTASTSALSALPISSASGSARPIPTTHDRHAGVRAGAFGALEGCAPDAPCGGALTRRRRRAPRDRRARRRRRAGETATIGAADYTAGTPDGVPAGAADGRVSAGGPGRSDMTGGATARNPAPPPPPPAAAAPSCSRRSSSRSSSGEKSLTSARGPVRRRRAASGGATSTLIAAARRRRSARARPRRATSGSVRTVRRWRS